MVLKQIVATVLEEVMGILLAERSERPCSVSANSASSVLAFAFLMRFFTLEKASSMNQPQCACIPPPLHRGTRSSPPCGSIHCLWVWYPRRNSCNRRSRSSSASSAHTTQRRAWPCNCRLLTHPRRTHVYSVCFGI